MATAANGSCANGSCTNAGACGTNGSASTARLRHIVLMKLPTDAPVDAVAEADTLAAALKEEFPSLVLSIRPTVTTDRAKGFTHVLYSEFDGMDELKRYSTHPAHVKFLSNVKPHMQDVLAMDVEV